LAAKNSFQPITNLRARKTSAAWASLGEFASAQRPPSARADALGFNCSAFD